MCVSSHFHGRPHDMRLTRSHSTRVPRLSGATACHAGLHLRVLDVLAEHDSHAIDVAQAKFADSIRLVRWLRCNLGASLDNLPVVGINILDPLEQVDTTWTAFVLDEVDRGVIAPHDCVSVVAEVPCKPQRIAIERCRRRDVGDMQYWCALHELFWI